MCDIPSSRLYDQTSFYTAFLRDLERAQSRVVIESPFITFKRMAVLFPTLRKLRRRGVRIIVNTKPLNEHEAFFKDQAVRAIAAMQAIGITVLLTVGHHRKLAIIDNDILWEGSLNILSQNDSCEMMRRIESRLVVEQMLRFTALNHYLDVD
jgi:phosphatidylserine/phosphatidylglycerophosphate/cardiolipin synthase-like enzyme